jgi:hypothetical protein
MKVGYWAEMKVVLLVGMMVDGKVAWMEKQPVDYLAVPSVDKKVA